MINLEENWIPAFAGMTWATATLTLKHPQNAPDDKTALWDMFPLYQGITKRYTIAC